MYAGVIAAAAAPQGLLPAAAPGTAGFSDGGSGCCWCWAGQSSQAAAGTWAGTSSDTEEDLAR